MRQTTIICCALSFLWGESAHALKVVATLPDLAAIAAEVGGKLVDVEVLAASTEDPHYVDPRPSLLVSLNRADVLISNGLGLEVGWLPKLLTNARNSKIQASGSGYFDASRVVLSVDVPTGPVDRSMGDVHPGGNPHYTFDPRQVARVAAAFAEHLSRLDATNASSYRANADRFVSDLTEFAEIQRARFGQLKPEARRIVTYHRSLSHLLDWLLLDRTMSVEPRPGISPDPGHIAKVLEHIRSLAIRVILQEEHYPRRASQTLAKLASAEVVIMPTATRFAQGESYIAHMTHIVDALYAVLAR